MTPYSAAAAGSLSSRASSRRAALSTSSGSSSASSRSRSSLISACSASPSPSSSWIAFSCWRRKNSRWPFSISDWTCDWIFVPSSRTSSSRFRIAETSRRRSSTFTSSSSRCFSSVRMRTVEATRWQSALGSSTLAAASCSSSGRYGHERDHAREEALHVARQRLDLARLLELVGQRRELGHEVRLVADGHVEVDALDALDEDPQRAVRDANQLVDDRGGADVVEIVEAGRVGLLVLHRHEREQALAGGDVVDQLDRALLADRERRHRLGEDDRLLERQHRHDRRQVRRLGDRLDELVAHKRVTAIVTFSRAGGRCASGRTIVSMPRSYDACAFATSTSALSAICRRNVP